MIDLHSHILHGLDDGPGTLRESIAMCYLAFQDGIRTVVATPHTLNGVYRNDRSTILAKVRELNEELVKLGVPETFAASISRLQTPVTQTLRDPIPGEPSSALRPPHPFLKILPGAEVYCTEDLLDQLERGDALTVGNGGKYLFVEFPVQGIPYGIEEIIFQLMMKGITPIISHPERNFDISLKPQRYFAMVKTGCLGQVTAMSLTGEFGGGVKKVAEKFLKAGVVHVIASDAHSPNNRPPVLSSAVRAAARIVGQKEALKMVTEYPQAILDGLPLNIS